MKGKAMASEPHKVHIFKWFQKQNTTKFGKCQQQK